MVNHDDPAPDARTPRTSSASKDEAPTNEAPASGDEKLPELLAAWGDALRADSVSQPAAGSPALPPEQQAESEQAQAYLRMLEQAWPRRGPYAGGGAEAGAAAPVALGRFQLRRELGRGGFGTVHLAYDPLLGREVALKVPHSHVLSDPELRARFQREARATAGLHHPNIVPVYEAGQCDSIAYIALAYCPGLTLHDWLRRHVDSLAGPVIAQFMATLAAAVQHAHGQGVVHRDLKPANVLLVNNLPEDASHADQLLTLDRYEPRITDFGLAKHLDGNPGETKTGTIAGTPCYMAPEQTGPAHSPIGPATDVYALGAILYELLTGRAPFQGETIFDTLAQVRGQDPIPPRRLRPGVPRDLEVVCLKCLEKDPARRYASAAALEEDLRRYLGGRSIQARPTGPLTQVAKWARRRPTIAALLSLALITALTLVASDIHVRRKNLETQRALQGEIEARNRLTEAVQRERHTLYFQRVRLAHAALLNNNVRQAERYLRECEPQPGQTDLRHWEWRYLQCLCHTEVTNFVEHQDLVSDAALNHDASRVASINRQGQGLVWEVQTGRVLWKFAGGQRHHQYSRVLDFSRCGRFLACGNSTDNSTTIFAAADGTELRTVLGSSPQFSADGEWLATLDAAANLVRICRTETGVERDGYSRAGQSVSAFTYVDNESWLATASQDQQLLLGRGGADESNELTGTPRTHFFLRISPDGKHVAAAAQDGSLVLWSTSGGRPLFTIVAHQSDITTMEFTVDGQRMVTSDMLGTIKIWDLQGHLVQSLPGHGFLVTRARTSPDGRWLVSAGADQTVKVWDLQRPTHVTVLGGHRGFVFGLGFSPNGQQLATTGNDQTVRIWNPATGKLLRSLAAGKLDIRHVAFRDDDHLIGSDMAGRIEVWNPHTGGRLRTIVGAESTRPQGLAISERGHYSAKVGNTPNAVLVRNLSTGQLQCTITGPSRVQHTCFSPEGQRLAVADADGNVTVYETLSGRRLLPLQSGPVTCAAFSSDGKWLATAGPGDEVIRLWDSQDGRHIRSFQTQWGRNNILSITFSPDGRRLATGGLDDTVTLWDVATGEEVLRLPSPGFGVTGTMFSPDGVRLAAIINDGTLAVWDSTPWSER